METWSNSREREREGEERVTVRTWKNLESVLTIARGPIGLEVRRREGRRQTGKRNQKEQLKC